MGDNSVWKVGKVGVGGDEEVSDDVRERVEGVRWDVG